MEYQNYLPQPLNYIIENYVHLDLMELAFDLLEVIPINYKILSVDKDAYLDEFIKEYNIAMNYYKDVEDFMFYLMNGILTSFIYINFDEQNEREIYDEMRPFIEKYLEKHPLPNKNKINIL